MLEIVVAKVFDTLFGPSSGPDIAIFNRFSASWKNINRSMYENGLGDSDIANNLKLDRIEIINFSNEQLESFHPRDDYEEFLQRTFFIL